MLRRRPVGLIQTFLPVPDLALSAGYLDDVRLGKQRVEVYQFLRTLDGVTAGWRNHPAVRMWRGYEAALIDYGRVVCTKWVRRGYADTVGTKLLEHRRDGPAMAAGSTAIAATVPPWFGDDALDASHPSNLIRKDPAWYRSFGWTEPDDLAYVWPVPKT